MCNLLKQAETERKAERHPQINKSSIFKVIHKLVLQNKIEQKNVILMSICSGYLSHKIV